MRLWLRPTSCRSHRASATMSPRPPPTTRAALLSSLRARPAELLRAFDWFGSYILEETVAEGDEEGGSDEQDDGPSTVCELVDARGRVSHVAHMDGRSSAPRAWLHTLPAFSSRCARA